MSFIGLCQRAPGQLVAGVQAETPVKKPSRPKRRVRKFEQLEDRRLMSVTQDASGWTVVGASADTRTVYVSSSTGNDANDGLTASTAKKTIAAGVALMRNNMPDHLLLNRGDTFTVTTEISPPSGRSTDEPILLGTYGTGDRPLINTADNNGIKLFENQYVSVIGWHLEATDRSTTGTPHGIEVWSDKWNAGVVGGNILFEDNYIDGYATAIILKGDGSLIVPSVTIRRDILVNSWSTTSHAMGIFADYVDGLMIEQNVLDHNGWKPGSTLSTPENEGGPTIYNHNMYLTHNNLNVTIRDNISSRASSMGLKFQPVEGTHYITNNLFVENGYAAQIGGGQAIRQAGQEGATIYANDNVFIESTGNVGGGFAVTIGNIKAGTFSNNIIANKSVDNNQFALSIQDGTPGWESIGVGVQNLTLANNTFYNWRGVVQILEPTNSYQGGPVPVFENIDFVDNTFQEPVGGYSGKLISTYTASSSVVSFTGDTYYSAGAASKPFSIAGTAVNLSGWKSATGETNATQQPVAFFDPTRSAKSYAAILGLTSYDELVAEISQQSRDNWNVKLTADAINDYIRAGFVPDPIGVTPLPAPSLGAPTGQSIQQQSIQQQSIQQQSIQQQSIQQQSIQQQSIQQQSIQQQSIQQQSIQTQPNQSPQQNSSQPVQNLVLPGKQDSSQYINQSLPASAQLIQTQSAALNQLLVDSVNRSELDTSDDGDLAGGLSSGDDDRDVAFEQIFDGSLPQLVNIGSWAFS